ncbi:MAG: hypothetical protein ACI9CF_001093 [Candidatus Omnitrophota bacterium]|jgi:hypothetical protein
MNLIKLFTIGFIAISLTGCATTMRQITPHKEYNHDWPVNSVRTVDLGTAVVARGEIYTYAAMDLQNDVSFGDGFFLKKFTVPAGELIAKKEDDKWTHYFAEDFTIYDSGFTSSGPGGLKINKTDADQIRIFWQSLTVKPSPKPIYSLKRVNATNKPGIRKELIYNGRVGDNVKFIYREITNNLSNKPFSQEVEYDITESNFISFKGAQIEVQNATERTITYKVAANFPGTDQLSAER